MARGYGWGAPPFKRRRTEVTDYSGYLQVTNLPRQQIGEALASQAVINRYVSSIMESKIDRFQWLSKMSDTNGKYWLSHGPDAATVTKYFMPYYAFDLTSLESNANVANTTGTVNYRKAYPFMRLKRNAATGNAYAWDYQLGVGNNGLTTSNTWQIERAPSSMVAAGNSQNTPYGKAFLRWADIRLQLWGAKNNPSEVEILLVRFKDDMISPSGYEVMTEGPTILDQHPPPAYVAADASGSNDYARYQKFWTAETDRLISTRSNPRCQQVDAEGMQVLHKKRIKFNPTATYETDTTGHQFTYKIMYNMDMIGDFDFSNSSTVVGDGLGVDTSDPNVWPQDAKAADCHAVLRNKTSRVFLIVRGFVSKSEAVSATGTGTAEISPSFDICVRRCVTLLDR